MQKFADEAPEDIRDDFQTLADAYSKIADALDGVDLGSGETPPAEAAREAGAALAGDRLGQAQRGRSEHLRLDAGATARTGSATGMNTRSGSDLEPLRTLLGL